MITVKPGDVKSANLAVASFLVAEHKYSKSKAAEAAVLIVKKARKEKENFDGAFLTKFTEQELAGSVSKSTTTKKEPKPKVELNAVQLKTANDTSKTINERARQLLMSTGFTKITAIANALTESNKSIGEKAVTFQRVTNVRKNMQKSKVDTSEAKVKPVAPVKSAADKTMPAAPKAAPAKRVKKEAGAPKRKYTKKNK